MLHITHHALHRLTTRTSLTANQASQAITQGLPLDAMPSPIQAYIVNRDYKAIYRLYLNTILVYRPNTYHETKTTRPYALITVLVLPAYLKLDTVRAPMQ